MTKRHKKIRLCTLCLALITGGLMLLAGCAQWSPDNDWERNAGMLQPLRSLDAVVLETVLVRFPVDKADELVQVWNRVDESLFDIETRKRLDSNGLRAGLLSGELPKLIRDQLHETSDLQTTDLLEHAGLAADVDNMMRRRQCRAGRRKDIVVRQRVAEPLTVLTTLDGKTVNGATYEQPTVLFAMKVTPHGDGQATIELIPEIQYGQPKQSYISTEFGMRPDSRRAYTAWGELAITARMGREQVLVVAGTHPPKALGSAFFTTITADQSKELVVLLVRLAETQLDELFAPDDIVQADAMAER